MGTIEKINDLHVRKQALEAGGGSDRIAKQHEAGKLTARERLEKLFEQDTFVEVDAFVETRAIDFDMQKKKVPATALSQAMELSRAGRYSYPHRTLPSSEVRLERHTPARSQR
jgi:acetyl-CoA carboxylase carboxyltransferase component